jgi:hypothetical protein
MTGNNELGKFVELGAVPTPNDTIQTLLSALPFKLDTVSPGGY